MGIEDFRRDLRKAITARLEADVDSFLKHHLYAQYFMLANLVKDQVNKKNFIVVIKYKEHNKTKQKVLQQFAKRGIDYVEISKDFVEMSCVADNGEKYVLVDYSNGVVE